jgi:hypothetical protein
MWAARVLHLGAEALNLFKDLPAEGMLFPYLSSVRAGDRATEFGQRCQRLGIRGVTLHSYRYAWAERAKMCGYPERFAQEALGNNRKAVHRAYAKRALMKIPSLEDYEKRPAWIAIGGRPAATAVGAGDWLSSFTFCKIISVRVVLANMLELRHMFLGAVHVILCLMFSLLKVVSNFFKSRDSFILWDKTGNL